MSRQIVTVVNPQLGLDFDSSKPKKKRAKKKTAKKTAGRRAKKKKTATKTTATTGCVTVKRNKKGQFVKRGGSSKGNRTRRRNSGQAPAVIEVVENKSRRRRRRRRNPEGGGVEKAWRRAFGRFVPRIGAKFAVAYVVRQWGGKWGEGIMGQKATSPFAGEGWSLWNYALAGLVAYFGGRVISRYNKEWGRAWADSIWDDMVTRLIWTEGLARSKTAQDYFGQDMIGWDDDPYGNRFAVIDGTQYQPAMLGIERASPIDGLVAAGPMDGLVRAGAWERRRAPLPVAAPMGHLQDPWFQRGSANAYQAAYMQ